MRISRTSPAGRFPPAMSAEPKPDFREFAEFADVLRKQRRRSEKLVRRALNRAKAHYPVPFDELNLVSRALDNALSVVERHRGAAHPERRAVRGADGGRGRVRPVPRLLRVCTRRIRRHDARHTRSVREPYRVLTAWAAKKRAGGPVAYQLRPARESRCVQVRPGPKPLAWCGLRVAGDADRERWNVKQAVRLSNAHSCRCCVGFEQPSRTLLELHGGDR